MRVKSEVVLVLPRRAEKMNVEAALSEREKDVPQDDWNSIWHGFELEILGL